MCGVPRFGNWPAATSQTVSSKMFAAFSGGKVPDVNRIVSIMWYGILFDAADDVSYDAYAGELYR